MIRMGMGQIPAGNADLFSCGSTLPEETVDPVIVIDLEIVTTVNQEETAVAAADDETHAAVDEGVVYFVLPNGGLRSAHTRIGQTVGGSKGICDEPQLRTKLIDDQGQAFFAQSGEEASRDGVTVDEGESNGQ